MQWIICHDAGGAEIISSWKKANSGPEFRYVLEGPAKAIFQRKLGDVSLATRDSFLTSVQAGDFVLTGTGWASDLEKVARAKAAAAGASVVAVLDHWANYSKRFQHNGQLELPSEIWVADPYALAIAQKEFPETKIKEIRNDYLEEIKKEIASAAQQKRIHREASGLHILYICECTTEHLGKPKSGDIPEILALNRFVEWLEENNSGVKVAKFLLRPHPAEKPGKYDSWIRQHGELRCEIGPKGTLSEECGWADWVVGMGSMALVVAAYAGKRTISCMPKAEQKSALPYKEIERI